MEKTKTLILMYSVIAVFILNLTYIARVNPELPCSILFDEEEWKVLYYVASRRKEASEKPYTIGEAVEYIGNLGGPRRAPSDGPPGVKTIWWGLQKFYTLYDYREMFDFYGSSLELCSGVVYLRADEIWKPFEITDTAELENRGISIGKGGQYCRWGLYRQ
jgi:hypothetical protein